MLGTSDVVRVLVRANPESNLTEDRVRWVLRRGRIPPLSRVAGRFVWSPTDIAALAAALGLVIPDLDDEQRCVATA